MGRKCEKGAEGSLGTARQRRMSQPTKQRSSGLSRRGQTQVYLSPALAMSRAAVSTGEVMLQKQTSLKSQSPTKTKVNVSLLVRDQRGSAGTLLTMVTQEPGWWRLCLKTSFHSCPGWAAGMGMAHWLLRFLCHILLAKHVPSPCLTSTEAEEEPTEEEGWELLGRTDLQHDEGQGLAA